MRKLVLFVVLVSLFTACVQNGGEIAYQPAAPDKWPITGANITRVVLYVDTSKPLDVVRNELKAAGSYFIRPLGNTKEVAYFDYIVISGGEIRAGTVAPYLRVTPEFLKVIGEYDSLIRPLRSLGIKILLGVTGGEDGVALGSFPRDEEIKNQGSVAQEAFARFVSNSSWFYGLDGAEFWDKDAEKAGSTNSPYPTPGKPFYNGEQIIPALVGDGTIPRDDKYYWEKGGGFMIDMMAFVLEQFGAKGTHAGDLPFDQKVRTPLLVRERNFGQWIPDAVPRYEFASSMAVISYLVGDSTEKFGYDDDGHANPLMAGNIMKNYSPIILDLGAITQEKLRDYSKRLGSGRDDEGNYTKKGNSDFYLVYYQNLSGSASLENDLNITADEVFGARVRVK